MPRETITERLTEVETTLKFLSKQLEETCLTVKALDKKVTELNTALTRVNNERKLDRKERVAVWSAIIMSSGTILAQVIKALMDVLTHV